MFCFSLQFIKNNFLFSCQDHLHPPTSTPPYVHPLLCTVQYSRDSLLILWQVIRCAAAEKQTAADQSSLSVTVPPMCNIKLLPKQAVRVTIYFIPL